MGGRSLYATAVVCVGCSLSYAHKEEGGRGRRVVRVRSESEANLDEVGNRAIGGVERIRRNHSRGGVGTYRPDMFGMLAMLICSAREGTTRELRIAMSANWRVNVATALRRSKCFLRT